MPTKIIMQHIILFNLKLIFDKKANWYISFLFTFLMILSIVFSEFKLAQTNVISSEHLFFLEQEFYFKFFSFFLNILFPIIFFFLLLPFKQLESMYSILPVARFEIYKGWLGVIALFLLFLGLIFVAIVLLKIGFRPNNGFSFNHFTYLLLWVFGILIFSFFSNHMYILFLYLFKSKYPTIIFQIASIFFFQLDYFFWMPMNWAFVFVDAVHNSFAKLNFFKEYPINSLFFLFTCLVFSINYCIKRLIK